MAIEFILDDVENKLNTFASKGEKLKYLNKYLFGLKKKLVEFAVFDEKDLNRLIKKTEKDFEKYQNEFDKGKLVYWSNTKSDKLTAERLGIENVELLKRRLKLENTLSDLQGRIKLFESLIEREEKEYLPPQPTETNSNEKMKFYTDKDFALLIEELLQLMPIQVKDFLDYHYSKAFIHDAMSGLNWIMALRKNLMQRFKEPKIIGKYSMIPLEGTPQQIGLAYMWERNKSSQIVIETNARSNKKPEQKAAPVAPLPKIEKPTLEHNKETAGKYLNFLTGCNIRKEKIMNDTDFQRLLNYTYHLIEFEVLPTKIKPIPQTNISTDFLRYTFYLTHKELYGTKRIKINWIDFLHNVFGQFKNVDKKTTKTKFSVKPSLYDKDIEQMKT